jgi:hypothetical protein
MGVHSEVCLILDDSSLDECCMREMEYTWLSSCVGTNAYLLSTSATHAIDLEKISF